MEYLVETVINYVYGSQSNPYALMINGKWGSGKTWFLKNKIKPAIESKKDNPKKVIYISLNGVADLSEIIEKIAFEKAHRDNVSDFSKSAYKMAKIGVKVLSRIVKIKKEDLKEFDIKDFFNLDDCVICFDDLERLSKEIDVIDVLGFINSNFIEHYGIRTIIIGDENNINGKEEYNEKKEKVIGRTLLYKANIKEFLDNIINKESDLNYKKILTDNEDFLLKGIRKSKIENLRSILFMIDNLKKVFTTLSETKVLKYLSKTIIQSVLSLSLEWKEVYLNKYQNQDDLPYQIKNDFNFLDFTPMLFTETQENDVGEVEDESHDKFGQEFKSKYIDGCKSYVFIPPIFDYVSSGYLDRVSLKQFLKSILPVNNPKRVKLISKLRLGNFKGDKEFTDLLSKLNKYIANGKYNLFEYVAISSLLIGFSENNLLDSIDLNKDNIESFLTNNIDNNSRKNIKQENKQILRNKIRTFDLEYNGYDNLIESLNTEYGKIMKLDEQIMLKKVFKKLKRYDIKSVQKFVQTNNLVMMKLFAYQKNKNELYGLILNQTYSQKQLFDLLDLLEYVSTSCPVVTKYEKDEITKRLSEIDKKLSTILEGLDNKEKPITKRNTELLIKSIQKELRDIQEREPNVSRL